ncbi:hypothetical protein N5D36_20925 [Pseudomonas mosselii]|uniref:DUF6602 domain-containing protein n=1 Tax=Pseudomonas mosselii TaxID=78327 RepID=UPI002447CCBC|nr:DUF6602 domain-containing protein [Pseudomonas mosselii]MDH0630838.1 hypothetical protein [Pseudomonas mosselii]MDH0679917.1 hypothetical protein [Pseudomonas mosselii]MDH0928039.1 hypothetical protein [Pseudomonas mosselii]MDH1137733.1 hypothetical protein [Pseudomonas mosselii]MDH1142578.1 hypothetical protein [Pseudomonas mosselii]
MHEDVYRAKISELRSMFSATKSILHNGEKGSLREAFLVNLIQLFLPSNYGIGSGIVIDKFGRQSVQVDIVIYDKRAMPPVLEAAGRGIYPVDSVVRVIEVKSNVNKASLVQFSEMIKCFDPSNTDGLKVASAGRLTGGMAYYPVCAMFGFESTYRGFADECERNPVISGSSSLICLDGVGLWTHKPKYSGSLKLPYDGRYMTFEDNTHGLRMFIGMLLDQIDATAQSRSGYRPLDWLL